MLGIIYVGVNTQNCKLQKVITLNPCPADKLTNSDCTTVFNSLKYIGFRNNIYS